MRDIQKVIDQVLGHLPEEYERTASRLRSFKESANYCPPEEMGHWWENMMVVLNSELPVPPETDWQKEIYRIVTQKEPT